MKKLIFILSAAILAGCASEEPAELTQPYNVETARGFTEVSSEFHQSFIEVAEAVLATPELTPEPEPEGSILVMTEPIDEEMQKENR